jgi:hypothetical protein
MRDNDKRRRERARRRQLFEQLRLQAEVLCDSYNHEGKATTVLNRMMLIILDVTGQRGLNDAKRQAFADHFTDCTTSPEGSIVELGGGQDRNIISISGSYDIGDLAKRIAWSQVRTGETIENSA